MQFKRKSKIAEKVTRIRLQLPVVAIKCIIKQKTYSVTHAMYALAWIEFIAMWKDCFRLYGKRLIVHAISCIVLWNCSYILVLLLQGIPAPSHIALFALAPRINYYSTVVNVSTVPKTFISLLDRNRFGSLRFLPLFKSIFIGIFSLYSTFISILFTISWIFHLILLFSIETTFIIFHEYRLSTNYNISFKYHSYSNIDWGFDSCNDDNGQDKGTLLGEKVVFHFHSRFASFVLYRHIDYIFFVLSKKY